MKPHAWAQVHGYARPTVVSPIANVIVVNVTTRVSCISFGAGFRRLNRGEKQWARLQM